MIDKSERTINNYLIPILLSLFLGVWDFIFMVNGEENRIGSVSLSWHIHSKLDVPLGNGETAHLGSSMPSQADYDYESRKNTGSTFVVGQRDNSVQYYHNGKNTINLSWKKWKRLAGF